MAKADSRTAAKDAVREVGREYVRTNAGPRGRATGTGMADQAAPMGSPGRAAALRRPVQPDLRPRDAARRVGASETQPGVADRRCRWPDPQAGRADRRGAGARRASSGAQERLLPAAAVPRAADPEALGEAQKPGRLDGARQDRADGDQARARADLRGGLLPDLVWISARAPNSGRHRAGAVLHPHPSVV
jgi:hypothetical protein